MYKLSISKWWWDDQPKWWCNFIQHLKSEAHRHVTAEVVNTHLVEYQAIYIKSDEFYIEFDHESDATIFKLRWS